MGFDKEASSSSHGLSIPAEATSSAPLLPPHRPLSSQPKTFANLFIAIVGAGVLGLPYTFKRTGWAAGALMIVVVAVLSYHGMMLLVYTRRKLEVDRGFSKVVSFGDLAFTVSGPAGRLAVDVMIVLSQAGFCASYLIFVGNTLSHLINGDAEDGGGSSSSAGAGAAALLLGIQPKSLYIWGIFPFQLGLNSIRTLTHLAPLSIFADVVEVGSMGVVMVGDVALILRRRLALRAFGSPSLVFYGIGVAVSAFEGVGVVLPLESEAANKDRFGRLLGVSMSFIAVMYALFGMLGYFAFGEDTRDIITTNLGRSLITQLVQVGLCVNLFFTFPLMMNPVHEVVERRLAGNRYSLWLRWPMVMVVTLVAILVPNFADFLSLVGSSVCCVLGFVLPAWFHLKVFRDEMDLGGVALDAGVIALGLLLAVTGTWSSLAEILGVKS